jgi:SNF2 family DNA or RNA helicase
MELNSGSSPLSNITNTMDARHNAKKFEGKPVKRQLSLEGFLVNKKQKTGADENILMSPDTKDKVNKIREIMPELPTQKVIAALKRSNSNIEAATVDLLDAAFLEEDVNTSYDAVDLSDDRDISDPVVEDSNSNNNKLIQQVQELVPHASLEGIRGALLACHNNIEEAVDLLIDIKPYRPPSNKSKSVEPIDKSAWDNAVVIDLTSPQQPLSLKKPIALPNSPLINRGYTVYGSDEAEEDNNEVEDEQDIDLFADDMEDEVVMYSPPANTKTFNKKPEFNTKRRLIVEEEDDDSLSEIDENYVGHLPGFNMAVDKEDETNFAIKNMLAKLLEAQDLVELADTPPDLKVDLYEYQRQGLAWLLKKEKAFPLGGILADQMGLGKTVQLISLILANRPQIDNTTWISINRTSGSFEVGGRKKLNNDRKATLIVCPTSCVNQWHKEVTSKTRSGALSVKIHYGNTRAKKAEQLCHYDVVITTYGVVANESPAEPAKWGPTKLVKWFRVILDEAHNVRNTNTKSFKSCFALDSQMRWCVTGTPIQNKIEDLQSLMKIIRYQPFCDSNFWKASVGTKDGQKRVQDILSPILLCRTKTTTLRGKPIIELPARNVVIREIELADIEGVEYKQLEQQSKTKFDAYLRAGLVRNFQNVLTLLLRLRQMCDHPFLVKRNLISSSGSVLSQKDKEADICSICFDVPEEPTYTPCGHLFCKQCLYGEFEKDLDTSEQTLCPTCKTFVTEDKLLSPTKKKHISKTSHLIQSTKIRALMEELNNAKKTDPKFKAIIFSQWTSMLDLVEAVLTQNKWKYGRLDGEMLLNHRTAELERFKKSSECNLLLMSLKVGGVGLNVTEANYVYLLDPWWNPAIEEQAIDRVHRVGQKKAVHVVRFIIKDSVEKRILALQEKKREIAEGALGSSQSGANRLTERDLIALFS